MCLEMLDKRCLTPAKDAFFIQCRIIQPQMDKILIESAPAFSIFPVHHREEWEPCIADDRDPFPAERPDCGNRFIHPFRTGFDIPIGRGLCDHDRHLVAFPGFPQDDLDLMSCRTPNNLVGFAIRAKP